MNDNVWYTMNSPAVNKLIYRLKELKMKGTINHEIDPEIIVNVINALVKENCGLVLKLNSIETKNNEAEKLLETVIDKKEPKKRNMDHAQS